jgi:hypothetical protein
MDAEIYEFLYLDDEAKMIAEIDRLIGVYGAQPIGEWTDSSKHKHRLIHWLAWKGYSKVLEHVFG